MSKFNEANTIEEGIKDLLKNKTDEKWKYFHGSDLPREDHEVFIDTWLKKAICKLNPEICDSPLKADEIIYKLRSILVEVDSPDAKLYIPSASLSAKPIIALEISEAWI